VDSTTKRITPAQIERLLYLYSDYGSSKRGELKVNNNLLQAGLIEEVVYWKVTPLGEEALRDSCLIPQQHEVNVATKALAVTLEDESDLVLNEKEEEGGFVKPPGALNRKEFKKRLAKLREEEG